MPREQIRSDYTQEELDNLKSGKCWCGIPRDKFEKGMRVYCSKEHRNQWYQRTITWGNFRDQFISKAGYVCIKCGKSAEGYKADYQKTLDEWYNTIINNAAMMDVIERERIEALHRLDKEWEEITDTRRFIFRHFGYGDRDGIPKKPAEPWNFTSNFEVDHILAVSLGGDMWDENNLQVLCSEHHKEKTKQDMQKLRAKKSGQTTIQDS